MEAAEPQRGAVPESLPGVPSGRDNPEAQVLTQSADLVEAVAIDQRHMVACIQLLLEEVVAVLHPEEHALGAGIIPKANAANDFALGNKQRLAVGGNPAHGDLLAHIPVKVIAERYAKSTGCKGADGIRRLRCIPALHIPPGHGVPGKNHIVRISLYHIHAGIVDIRMEEGRQAIASGGNGLGIVGGVAHIGRLVHQAGENCNGQAGGNIVFAGRGNAHFAQQRVGQAEGHPLLIQPTGGAGIGTGGGKGVAAVIVQHFLVDFKMAEHIKLESTVSDKVTYKDIMSIEHTIPSSEVWDVVSSVVEKITTEVASKIKELNGGNTVSACFVVGGGGKVHGFTENLAKELDLPEERVALRGEEVLGEVTFQQPDIKKDPLLVTPIGICLNYYEQRNNFIMVRFNGERLKLYDNNRLTIVDAALQAGFPNDQLFPKRGVPINFTVNGASRIARGEAGEAAIVTMNGQHANINTPLEPNSEITIEPSTAGDDAVYTIGQLEEYRSSTIKFIVNGHEVTCPKFVQVNGSLEPETYHIKEGDAIEMRNFYTVEQVAEFMDVALEPDEDIYVNNAPATFDTLVYENFSINWKDDPYGVARRDDNIYTVTEENDGSEDEAESVENEEISDETTESKAAGSNETSESKETGSDGKSESKETGSDGKSESKETESDETSENMTAESDETAENESTSENKTAEDITKTEETSNMYTPSSFTKQDGKSMVVTVNGEPVELIGKEAYIFVDIFNRITFDLNAGKGRAIATIINGRDAQFTEELHDGDKIELYWKEN